MNPTSHPARLPVLAAALALALTATAAANPLAAHSRHAAHGTPPAAQGPARPLASRAPARRVGTGTPAPRPFAALVARGAQASGVMHAKVVHAQRAVVHAHMAGDPAVSIVDYSFSPGTTTIHVGDTITWTNTGKQPHSATADNHSFDTGILRTGQSASHTFTTAGTFTYYCIVHPYMHGTVVVLAAPTASSTPSATSSPTTSTTPTTTTPTSTAGQLPLTGSDELGAFAIGFLFVGAGFALRLRTRRPAQDARP